MDYFAFTTDDGELIRLPFPMDLPLDEREAYMAARIAAHASPSDEE
jgi:hypothetical protein